MRRIGLSLVLSISLLGLGCNFKKELSKDFKGNWISRDYLEELDKQNGDPSKVELYCEELVFPGGTDSIMQWVNLGTESHNFTYEIMGKRKIRINNFNQDMYTDMELSNDGKTLSYYY